MLWIDAAGVGSYYGTDAWCQRHAEARRPAPRPGMAAGSWQEHRRVPHMIRRHHPRSLAHPGAVRRTPTPSGRVRTLARRCHVVPADIGSLPRSLRAAPRRG
ncbi:hypothetical protein ACFPN0_31415 [Kitasatospora cinereorecta]